MSFFCCLILPWIWVLQNVHFCLSQLSSLRILDFDKEPLSQPSALLHGYSFTFGNLYHFLCVCLSTLGRMTPKCVSISSSSICVLSPSWLHTCKILLILQGASWNVSPPAISDLSSSFSKCLLSVRSVPGIVPAPSETKQVRSLPTWCSYDLFWTPFPHVSNHFYSKLLPVFCHQLCWTKLNLFLQTSSLYRISFL